MYDFSEDLVLLCLVSEHCNEEEYIRDNDKLIKIVNQ